MRRLHDRIERRDDMSDDAIEKLKRLRSDYLKLREVAWKVGYQGKPRSLLRKILEEGINND